MIDGVVSQSQQGLLRAAKLALYDQTAGTRRTFDSSYPR